MLRFRTILPLTCLLSAALLPSAAAADQPLKVLIIGGQNNHSWAKSTPYMEQCCCTALANGQPRALA